MARLEDVERSVKIKLKSLAAVERAIHDDMARVRMEERRKVRAELEAHREKVAEMATRRAADEVVAHYDQLVAELKASHRSELAAVIVKMERKHAYLQQRTLDLQRQLGRYQVAFGSLPADGDAPQPAAPRHVVLSPRAARGSPRHASQKQRAEAVAEASPQQGAAPGAANDDDIETASVVTEDSAEREASNTRALDASVASLRATLEAGAALISGKPGSQPSPGRGVPAKPDPNVGTQLRKQMDQAFAGPATTASPQVDARGSVYFGRGWQFSQSAAEVEGSMVDGAVNGSSSAEPTPLAPVSDGVAQALAQVHVSGMMPARSDNHHGHARASIHFGEGWKFSPNKAAADQRVPDAGRQDWREAGAGYTRGAAGADGAAQGGGAAGDAAVGDALGGISEGGSEGGSDADAGNDDDAVSILSAVAASIVTVIGGTVEPAEGFTWPPVFQLEKEAYQVNQGTLYHYHPDSGFYYHEGKNLYCSPPGFDGAPDSRRFFFFNPETVLFEEFTEEAAAQARAQARARSQEPAPAAGDDGATPSSQPAGQPARRGEGAAALARLTVRSALASAVPSANQFDEMEAKRQAAAREAALRRPVRDSASYASSVASDRDVAIAATDAPAPAAHQHGHGHGHKHSSSHKRHHRHKHRHKHTSSREGRTGEAVEV